MTRRIGLLSLAGIVAAAVLVLGWWWLAGTHRAQAPGVAHTEPLAVRVAKGAYLARAGNCMNCHTRQGGEPYAGGRAIETPFGIVYSSNLTPDRTHGIGNWTSVDFWRALHEGRAPGGRLLYPAFPYTSFTQVNQDDADALFAYLRSLPAVRQPNRDHAMRWPYDSQLALAAWRSLYFTPAVFQKDVTHDEQWNRGAYLVRGLGHCNACHASRNLLGAVDDRLALAGGTMPMNNWYAPSLLQPTEAGLASWEIGDIVRLLGSGQANNATVIGPMAEVVFHGTQHLTQGDLAAMAIYLKSLPQEAPASASSTGAATSTQGAEIYEARCAQCHGKNGEGVPGAYSALAGNRAVLMQNTANLVQVVLHGGFAPSTQGNPRPFGMPPYKLVLDDKSVAAVLTHVRSSWGNQAAAVREFDVSRYRATDKP
ncbi:MAG: cytochrome c [Rhodoferax sp.]|nr:cytochrome c [Rhodoferax sp.]HQX59338.1 cytochrome c [Burkholderiaceae bacterium]HQZ07538.1 cytochrome c [Burkholderiaceae bacterium]